MSDSAPKRRKTSPTTSVPIESTTPQDDPPPRSQRPSYASPTRVNLAKHNPEILSTRRPAPRVENAEEAPASRPSSRHSEGDGTVSDPAGTRSPGQIMSDPPAVPEGSRRISPRLAAQVPRPRPNPRPLPPPGPDIDEDIINPFLRRGLHRSPPTGVLPPPEEPELPPTPQHPDPVVSTPPSGIHNTPSKRPRRSKALAEQIERGSSPSKMPSEPPQKPPQKPSQSQLRRVARRGSPVRVESAISPQPQPQPQPKERKISSEFFIEIHASRRVIRPSADEEKRKERDALLEEVARLEADLELAKKENESVAGGLPLSSDKIDILNLLRRHLVAPGKEPEPDATTQWLETAMNTAAFLPFGGSSSIVSLFPRKKSKEEKAPLSHHPVAMTAEEELPYLQAFTPLTFTSSISMLPRESSEGPTLQRHTIHVRSANPPGLFTASIEMTVNTKTLAITNLAVPRLEPAAAKELQPFMENLVRPLTATDGKGTNSAHARNISLVTWAMSEWYMIAVKRAKFWHTLERELGSKDGLAECVAAMRIRSKKRRRRQRDDDEDGDSQSTNATNGLGDDGLSKKELLPHMGRPSMDLEIPYLAESREGSKSDVRINWEIEFDWTGEARSKLGVEVGVPSKWHTADDRSSVVGIPKLFNKLVRGDGDPLIAVKTIVALLAGEAGS